MEISGYLHNSHTDTDSQNDSAVVQKPFLHAGYAALEEGKKERKRLGETRQASRTRRERESLFKTQLLASDLGRRGEE